jgi:hypothetical protein
MDEPITVDEPDRTLELRRPDVPTTLTDLAALKGEAIEIIEARAQVLQTLRTQAIRATHPEDWLLFKAPAEHGGQVVAYLQDCGCDRVRDLFGIEVFEISRPEKISGADAGVFHYVISGSGRCKLTRQTVESMEGGRSSTDDFCKDKTGAELELAVRKAARANLDGNVTRELAGMKSVPVDELTRAWQGTAKKTDNCRLGRGFGTRDERLGATRAGRPNVPPPECPICKVPCEYRPAKDNRPAFYGCPNWNKHPKNSQRVIFNAAEWEAKHQAPAAAAAPANGATADLPCTICGALRSKHTGKDHDYDAGREPGQEG